VVYGNTHSDNHVDMQYDVDAIGNPSGARQIRGFLRRNAVSAAMVAPARLSYLSNGQTVKPRY